MSSPVNHLPPNPSFFQKMHFPFVVPDTDAGESAVCSNNSLASFPVSWESIAEVRSQRMACHVFSFTQ